MAKTLNQFLEGKTAATGYLKVKSPDEQKFVDKHVRVDTADANGNGDEVFKAAKVKTIERKSGRKGYDPGDDEKVYESLESVDEVAPPGKEKMVKAIKKAYSKDGVLTAKEKAIAYATAWKAKKANEEIEQIDELSAATKDSYAQKAGKQLPGLFKKSASSADDARKYYNRKNTVRKVANEEAEQVDEIFDKTPAGKAKAVSYINKAAERIGTQGVTAGLKIAADEPSKKNFKKMGNRQKGIERAVNKLSKEEFFDLLATGELVFENEEIRTVSNREVTLLATVLDKLSEENQIQFCEVATKSLDGFDKMLSFAIQNKGE